MDAALSVAVLPHAFSLCPIGMHVHVFLPQPAFLLQIATRGQQDCGLANKVREPALPLKPLNVLELACHSTSHTLRG